MKARAKKAPSINLHSEKYIRILQMLETQLKRNRKGNSPFIKDVWSGSGVIQNGAELLRSRRELTTKVEEQPWPWLMRCASIYYRVCGCIFQEDWIVARSLGDEWYRLIGVRIGQGEDVNDFNLQTKELGCNYWSTYTKSGIEGVQVTSLHRDPIGVDNRSLRAKN